MAQYRRFPTAEEIKLGKEAVEFPKEQISAPTGFGSVAQPQMSTLDLVGLLGLVPMVLGGGKGGRSSTAGAKRPLTPAQKAERAATNRELGARAAAGDLQAKQSLVERMQGLLYQISTKYAPPTKMAPPDARAKALAPVKEPDISRGELQQVGSQAAMEALETYKSEKGDPAAHIKTRARGAMTRFKQDQSRNVRAPEEEIHARIALRKVDEALSKRHFQLTGEWREPDALAAASIFNMRTGKNLTPDDIRRLRGKITEESLSSAELALQREPNLATQPEQGEQPTQADRAKFGAVAQRIIEKYPPEMQAFIFDVTEGTKTDREIAKEHRISPSMVPRRYASTIRKLQTELGQLKQFSEIGVGVPAMKEPPMAAVTRAIATVSGKSSAEVTQYLEAAGIQTPEQLNRFVNEVRPPNTRVLPLGPPSEAPSREQAAREYSAQNLVPVGEALKRFYPYTPKKYTEEEKGPGPLQPGRYKTGAYGTTGLERRAPIRPFTPETRSIEDVRRDTEEFHKQQSGFKSISGGSGATEDVTGYTPIPTSNFRPELQRMARGMRGQPNDWTQRQPAPDRRAATAPAGRDFFFGNPGEDFYPGVRENRTRGSEAETYIRLRALINAMAPHYGRQ